MGEPSGPDEARLALRAREGDTRAFGILVERHQAIVRRACHRFLGPAEADDVAQETFVRAFVHVRRFDPARPLAPWLLAIARRLCLDRLRARARRPDSRVAPEELAGESSPEASAAAQQQLGLLKRAMRDLPEGQREALVLFHVEGLAYKEIAEILDVPMGTVMTWLHRARAQLRARLGDTSSAAPGVTP